jgi:hypothetical protein
MNFCIFFFPYCLLSHSVPLTTFLILGESKLTQFGGTANLIQADIAAGVDASWADWRIWVSLNTVDQIPACCYADGAVSESSMILWFEY